MSAGSSGLLFADLIISPSASLRAALARMTNIRRGILFVCEPDGRLTGVVTDGDLRRAILHDAVLSTPVSAVLNLDPISARSEEEARLLLRRHSAVAVPILDDSGIAVALVLAEGTEETAVLSRSQTDPSSLDTQRGAVAIIPARGGSERLPRKNLARIAGRSLVNWAVAAATSSPAIGLVLVSTDDEEVADEARRSGGVVPWLRPEHLAQSDTSTLDVLIHACEWLSSAEGDQAPDVAVLLEPTSPFRPQGLIDEAVRLLRNSPTASSVATVASVPHVLNPAEQLILEDGELHAWTGGSPDDRDLQLRQRNSLVFTGQVYAFRPELLVQGRSLFGPRCVPLIRPWHEFIDIDFEVDLHHAELMLAQYGIT